MARQRGSVLVLALMATALLSAAGLALALMASTEMMIASSYATGQELLYAAEAGLAIGQRELGRVADWNSVLTGQIRSAWVDGDPAVPRRLDDGSQVSLTDATNRANCGKPTACTFAETTTATEARPWGSNNPQWQLFAYGMLNHAVVVVWVGDDPADNDNDPFTDGTDETNPGTGIASVRAEAFGYGGGHRVIESTVRRDRGSGAVRRLSWAQIR